MPDTSAVNSLLGNMQPGMPPPAAPAAALPNPAPALTAPVAASAPATPSPAPESADTAAVNKLYAMVLPREGSDDHSISPKGAIGKGQILPSTAIPYLFPGQDPSDPKVQAAAKEALLQPKINEMVSKTYISSLNKRYPGDPEAVLIAYNAGPEIADKWLASGKDPSVLPNETQRYIGEPLSEQWGKLTPQERQMMQDRTAATDRAVNGLAGMMQEYAREAAQAPPGSKERDDLIAKYRGNLEQMQAEWRQKVASPPIEKPIDAFANFGSIAAIVGLLGGLLSRQHITAGLNGAAAAMTAINNNNHEAFEKAYDTWKTQTELGIQMINMENADIRSLLEDKHMAIDEKNARLQTLAAEMGFMKGVAGMQLDNIDRGWDFLAKREQAAQQMQLHRDMIQQHYDAMKLAHEDRAAALAARTQGGTLDKDTLSTMADQYIAGDKSVLQGLGYGNAGAANRAALRTAISQKEMSRAIDDFQKQNGRAPTDAEKEQLSADIGRRLALGIAEFGGLQQAERTGYGRVAQITLGASEAQQFAPLAIERSEAVDRTRYPTLNKLTLAAMEGTGDENVVRFSEANLALIDAYAQVIGRGNSQLTDAARTQATNALNVAWSKGQYAAAVDQINIEIQGALRAPGEMLGTLRENFGVAGHPGLTGAGTKSGALPAGIPAGSRQIGTKDGNPVYEAPDGSRYMVH